MTNKQRADKRYKEAYMKALSELREDHITEWKLLWILLKAGGATRSAQTTLIRREMINAFHDEFHHNLRMYRGKA